MVKRKLSQGQLSQGQLSLLSNAVKYLMTVQNIGSVLCIENKVEY